MRIKRIQGTGLGGFVQMQAIRDYKHALLFNGSPETTPERLDLGAAEDTRLVQAVCRRTPGPVFSLSLLCPSTIRDTVPLLTCMVLE